MSALFPKCVGMFRLTAPMVSRLEHKIGEPIPHNAYIHFEGSFSRIAQSGDILFLHNNERDSLLSQTHVIDVHPAILRSLAVLTLARESSFVIKERLLVNDTVFLILESTAPSYGFDYTLK